MNKLNMRQKMFEQNKKYNDLLSACVAADICDGAYDEGVSLFDSLASEIHSISTCKKCNTRRMGIEFWRLVSDE
jgi:hypothetical protein